MTHHLKKWHKYLKENKDSKYVAKVVLFIGSKILFLVSAARPFKGNLDLPGGHLKHGEDLINGLRRETKEETNLDIGDPAKIGQEDNIVFYYGNIASPKLKNIKLSDEHSDFKLLTPKEVQEGNYPITPSFLKMILRANDLKNKNQPDSIDLIQSTIFFSILLLLVKGLYS